MIILLGFDGCYGYDGYDIIFRKRPFSYYFWSLLAWGWYYTFREMDQLRLVSSNYPIKHRYERK